MKLSIQYTAGLIDGEGTITLSYDNKKDKWRAPIVSVSSTTLEILDALKESYGGCICKHKVYKDHHKQAYSWRCPRGGAVNLCTSLKDVFLVPENAYRAKMISDKYPKCTPRNGKYTKELSEAKSEFEYDFFHPSKP
jgi:hypothetical protein